MKKIPIAIQLWSLRDAINEDVPGTLAAVAAMGYQGIEFAGLANTPATDWVKMLDDNGLSVAGAHVGLNALNDENLQQTLDSYAAVGCKRLVVPSLDLSFRKSLDGYRRACSKLNLLADKLADQGFTLGYHNHAFEYELVENRVPYNVMVECLVSDVFLQFDMGWVYYGGADGVRYVRDNPGREKTVHLKAFHADKPAAVIGEDHVPWGDVFAACEEVGNTEWYIVEQEEYEVSPFDSVKRCLDNLRAMGK